MTPDHDNIRAWVRSLRQLLPPRVPAVPDRESLPMLPVHAARFNTLADLLDADADNPVGATFDLDIWGKLTALTEHDLPPALIPIDCGTQACAIGIACLSGAFAAEGFSYRRHARRGAGHDADGNNFVPTFDDPVTHHHAEHIPAVMLFFGIDALEFSDLFTDRGYQSQPTSGADAERAVAAKLRLYASKGRCHGT